MGLSSLAIGQPLLNLYGANPTVFSAASFSKGQICVFVTLVVLGPPTFALGLSTIAQLIDARLGRKVHYTICGIFFAMFGFVLTRNLGISSGVIALVDAVLLAAIGLRLLVSYRLGQLLFRYFAVLTPMVLFLFVFGSPAGDVLRSSEATTLATLELRQKPDVVMIIMDELGVEPLIRSDGTINDERFPGFAALADRTTWFPDTVTAANLTHNAVPSLLTGLAPQRGLQPYSWDHPRNLFTLLGSQYNFDAYEPLTSLCPTSLCNSNDNLDQDITTHSTRAVDLISSAQHSGLPTGVHVVDIEIQGDYRRSISAPAPAEFSVPINGEIGRLLSFGYGIPHSRAFTTEEPDGVRFVVSVGHPDGTRTVVFEEDLIPGLDPTVATWRNASIELSSTLPAFQELIFQSHPRGNSTDDWATWAEILLIEEFESSVAIQPLDASSSFSQFLNDALVVYGHLTLPSELREKLPPIDLSWGGFARKPVEVDIDAKPDDFQPWTRGVDLRQVFSQFRESGSGFGQLMIIDQMVERVTEAVLTDDFNRQPTMYFRHLTFPHRPYEVTPDRRVYPQPLVYDNFDTFTPATVEDARQGYQRYLYQIAAADQQVADLVRAFDDADVWDDIVFILTSDHGIGWEKGLNPRGKPRELRIDTYRIPLFISHPDLPAGNIDLCPATTLDVLPSLAGLLLTSIDWEFDGEDLFQGCPDRAERPIENGSYTAMDPFMPGIDDLLERSAHFATWIPEEGGVRSIASIGRSGHLVGTAIPDVQQSSAVEAWTVKQTAMLDSLTVDPPIGSAVPAMMSGTITLTQPMADGTEGLLVINGIVGGVIVQLDGVGPGAIDFSVIVDVALLRNGPPEILLAIHSPDGPIEVVGPPVNYAR
jgi:hypothetical protein